MTKDKFYSLFDANKEELKYWKVDLKSQQDKLPINWKLAKEELMRFLFKTNQDYEVYQMEKVLNDKR